MKKPIISIVIPTFNRRQDLIKLLHSIAKSDYPAKLIEVVIVDNAADPKLPKLVKKVIPKANVLATEKNLYSNGARKLGAKHAGGDYIFLLDDDNTLEANCLTALAEVLEQHPKVGVVGPVMLEGDSDVIWSTGAYLSSLGTPHYLYKGKKLKDTTLPKLIEGIHYFPNACMVRRTALQKAPLDDRTFPHNWAETDFCLRILSAKYQMVGVSAAMERHHIGYGGFLARVKPETIYDQAKSRILFRRRHLPKLVDWIKFWVIIFPTSSVVYFWRIINSSHNKLPMIQAYIRGTRDGISEPLQKPSNATGASSK